MTFQALDFKGNHFLSLLDDDYLSIKPTYLHERWCLAQITWSLKLIVCKSN